MEFIFNCHLLEKRKPLSLQQAFWLFWVQLSAYTQAGISQLAMIQLMHDFNPELEKLIQELEVWLSNGKSLSQGLKNCSLIPSEYIDLISEKEMEGRLENALAEIVEKFPIKPFLKKRNRSFWEEFLLRFDSDRPWGTLKEMGIQSSNARNLKLGKALFEHIYGGGVLYSAMRYDIERKFFFIERFSFSPAEITLMAVGEETGDLSEAVRLILRITK